MSEIDISSTEFRRLVKWRMYVQFGGLTPTVKQADLVDAATSVDIRAAMIKQMESLRSRISEIDGFIHEAALLESDSRQDSNPCGKRIGSY